MLKIDTHEDVVDAGKSRTKIYSVQKIDQIGYMDYRYYKLF